MMGIVRALGWIALGVGIGLLWFAGRELKQVETGRDVARIALAQCLKKNVEWEKLVQKWGADESRCDATVDFNKAMDVLQKELDDEARKKKVHP